MYNDYYLQQLDSKLSNTNNKLDDILENQEIIIKNQQSIISGDSYYYNKSLSYNHDFSILFVLCAFAIILTFSAELVEHFLFIKRS